MKLFVVRKTVQPSPRRRERKAREWRWVVMAETADEAVAFTRSKEDEFDEHELKLGHYPAPPTWDAREHGSPWFGLGVHFVEAAK